MGPVGIGSGQQPLNELKASSTLERTAAVIVPVILPSPGWNSPTFDAESNFDPSASTFTSPLTSGRVRVLLRRAIPCVLSF